MNLQGLRVDPKEIELAVSTFPGVTGSACIQVGDELVAFVTPETINLTKLSEHLQILLPPYHVPTLWEALPQFDLTPSRKIDKLNLKKRSPHTLVRIDSLPK